ncbi:hypothetical protein NL676_025288 [Syzygium grande]|nr:hypothetical protein NL676_025288 [Syzygium grande]
MAYGNTTISTAAYGPHWRNLRRLTALELFSPHRLAGSLAIRREEVGLLVRSLHEAAASAQGGSFTRVEMKSRLQELSFNIIMRMVSGKRYFGSAVDAGDAEVAGRFREVIKEIFELSGTDPSDFLPTLRKVVDFKGRERRMVEAAKRSDAILQGLIDEVRSRRKRSDSGGEAESKTMIDTMLSEGYSDDTIKGHITTMLSADESEDGRRAFVGGHTRPHGAGHRAPSADAEGYAQRPRMDLTRGTQASGACNARTYCFDAVDWASPAADR